MKLITKKNALGLIAVIMISPSIFVSPSAYAESSIHIESGLSYINQQNLLLNQTANTAGTLTTNRSGWLFAGRWGWQQMSASGGYSANAQASMNQGLGSAGNIRSITLDGSWMHAINLNWLSRLNLHLNDYQDDDQPAYNSQSGGGNFTLGWFGKQNSGLDFNAAWQKEQYDDNPGMAYKADRFALGSRYYFPHQDNRPYWSINMELSRFDAAKMTRYSYDTTRFSLTYNAWHWKKLEGNIQLSWRNNRFDNINTTAGAMNHTDDMNTGMGMFSMTDTSASMSDDTQSIAQKDTYLTTSLNLRYPLNKQWYLISNLNLGQYRPNLGDNSLLASGYLGISVKY